MSKSSTRRSSRFERMYEGLPVINNGGNRGFTDHVAAAIQLNLSTKNYNKLLHIVKAMYNRQPDSTITIIDYLQMLNDANLTIDDIGCNKIQASRDNDQGGYHYNQFKFIHHTENKKIRDRRLMEIGNFSNQKTVHTPHGIFTSLKEAAAAHGVDYITVSNRINSDKPEFDEWYYEDEISLKLVKILQREQIPFHANSNISKILNDERLKKLKKEAAQKFESVLRCLLIDVDNDPNSNETGERLARMYFDEIMSGRYEPAPKSTSFPNSGSSKYEGMLVVRAELRSVCSHHHQPVNGVAYIGVLPGEKVIGLSKYARIAQWCARRGTLQEELCNDIAHHIAAATETEDVAVYIGARHGCCENRGIMAHSSLTQTTVLLGRFKNPPVKEEFFDQILLQQQFARD